MLNRRADKLELLRIAEAVALEKSIDKELIIDSMENGIAKAAKSKFGSENEIKVEINRDNGDIGIFRKLLIVEKPENINLEISLEDAVKLNSINKDNKYQNEVIEYIINRETKYFFKKFQELSLYTKKQRQLYIDIPNNNNGSLPIVEEKNNIEGNKLNNNNKLIFL